MMFGIIFQECYELKKIKMNYLLANLHGLIWLIMSMLLVMAFNGNLKTSLMVNNYDDQTDTIADIFDKDLTLHTDVSFCGLLKRIAHLSKIRQALWEQASKPDSQMILSE